MKKDYNINEIEYILGQMKKLQKDHPKATVIFDIESKRILITYPLPDDFYKIRKKMLLEDA